jgi:hypothetical protein
MFELASVSVSLLSLLAGPALRHDAPRVRRHAVDRRAEPGTAGEIGVSSPFGGESVVRPGGCPALIGW